MLGNHLIIDLYGCNEEKLDNVDQIINALTEIAALTDVTVLKTVAHQFSPHGTTVLVIVSASHFSFHSWPEYSFASIDLFYCSGTFDIEATLAILRSRFQSQKELFLWIERGIEHENNTLSHNSSRSTSWISFSGTS